MHKPWSVALLLVVVSAPAAWTSEPVSMLPDPHTIPSTPHAPPPPLLAPAEIEPHQNGSTCANGHCKDRPGCLTQLAHWFTYRPHQLTSIHELHQPYYYQPGIYLYFSQRLIERKGYPPPPAQVKNPWSGSCSSGVRMFAPPTSQNAGFLP